MIQRKDVDIGFFCNILCHAEDTMFPKGINRPSTIWKCMSESEVRTRESVSLPSEDHDCQMCSPPNVVVPEHRK